MTPRLTATAKPPPLRAPSRRHRNLVYRYLMTTPGLLAVRLAILAVFLFTWEAASGTLVSKFWVSSPSAIFAVLQRWVIDGSLWTHLQATLTAIAAGYVIGCAFGVGLGLMLGFMPRLHRVIAPYLSALYSIPKIALAPLFVIVLGIGIESKICLVAVTVFFLVLFSTIDGIRDIDRDLVRSLELMGASRWEISTKIVIPSAKKWILTGMRIAVRYASTAAILGELIASNRGLGFLIEYNSGMFNAAGVFAAVSILVLIGVALTELLTRFDTSSAPVRTRAGF